MLQPEVVKLPMDNKLVLSHCIAGQVDQFDGLIPDTSHCNLESGRKELSKSSILMIRT